MIVEYIFGNIEKNSVIFHSRRGPNMHIIVSAALHQQQEFQYFEHTKAKMTDNISNIYWWMKIVVFQLKLYWNLFKYPMDYKSALVQVIHWRLFGNGADVNQDSWHYWPQQSAMILKQSNWVILYNQHIHPVRKPKINMFHMNILWTRCCYFLKHARRIIISCIYQWLKHRWEVSYE